MRAATSASPAVAAGIFPAAAAPLTRLEILVKTRQMFRDKNKFTRLELARDGVGVPLSVLHKGAKQFDLIGGMLKVENHSENISMSAEHLAARALVADVIREKYPDLEKPQETEKNYDQLRNPSTGKIFGPVWGRGQSALDGDLISNFNDREDIISIEDVRAVLDEAIVRAEAGQ